MILHCRKVGSGHLQKRQIQLLDVCNLSPECVHSFPDSTVHVQLDYIFSPEATTKRYGVVWCNSVDSLRRDAMEQDSSDLAAVPSPFALMIRCHAWGETVSRESVNYKPSLPGRDLSEEVSL